MTKTRALLAIIVILILGLAFDSYKVIHTTSNVHRDEARISVLASSALNLSLDLERQRYDVNFDNCQDQNDRNKNAVKKFDSFPSIRPYAKPLLDAVIPVRDCDAVAAHSLVIQGPPIPEKVQLEVRKQQQQRKEPMPPKPPSVGTKTQP